MKPPKILEHEGRPAFAVLPYEEYMAIRRRLEELEELEELCSAEQADSAAPGKPLDEALRDLGLDDSSIAPD